MRRVYFVIVSSDVEHFEETTAYYTKEQAKEGLKEALYWTKKAVIEAGFGDEMEITENEDNFTINYNKFGDRFEEYYFGQIVKGSMFDEGEEVVPNKCYRVKVITTTTYDIVAHNKAEAITIAKEETGEYDGDTTILTEVEEMK